MFRGLASASLAILVSAPAFAVGQTQPAPAAPAATIRVQSDLVVFDVVARDSHQKPVPGLTASDFTVLEDGKPQTITAFEEHRPQPTATLPPLPPLLPGFFTNYSPAPASGPLNILLLDALNTPIAAQMFVRDQVLQFLKTMRPGVPVAIFSLTSQLKLLQGFTTNPEVLRGIVAGKKGNPGASPLMNHVLNGDEPGDDDLMNDLANDLQSGAMGNSPDSATMAVNLKQFEAETQSFQFQLRARYTLDALNELARYLSALPGRKNLIWFSGSFPLDILPDGDLTQDPFAAVASAEGEFRQTVDMLARARVAVYPIDARGLMAEPMLNASQTGKAYSSNPAAFAKVNNRFFAQTTAEHDTMRQMAEDTGGEAFVDTNGLAQSVDKALDAGSHFYTIAYRPGNQNWNGAYRKIQVKLNNPGVTLDYRRGYYADHPDVAGDSIHDAGEASAPGQYDSLRAALQHGAPEPTQLIFVATVRPLSKDTVSKLAPGNQGAKKLAGPYRMYAVTFLSRPGELNWTDSPDGKSHCALEFMSVVYDADGTALVSQFNNIQAAVSKVQFAALAQSGLKFTQEIAAPVKGEFYLRMAMRDSNADHLGAIELPLARVAALPPLDASAPKSK